MYTNGLNAHAKLGIFNYFIEGNAVDVGDNNDDDGGRVAAAVMGGTSLNRTMMTADSTEK